MRHDTYTRATVTRLVCGLLRCTSPQGYACLCSPLGCRSQRQHGAALRRFAVWLLQALAVEMLHRGLSQEEGDICRDVQGQDRASSLLQLYAWSLREDFHSGLVQLHKGEGNALRYQQGSGLLQKGESELAASLLRDALGYQRLLHAHCEKEAAGDCHNVYQEDGQPQDQQGFTENVARRARRGFHLLANGGNHPFGSARELHHGWQPVGLGRSRSCEEYAPSCGRSRSAYRKPHITAILECLSELARSVHQACAEMQVLWQICRRWHHSEQQEGMAVITRASDTDVPKGRAWFGSAHGKAAGQRGTQGYRVLRCIHQAISYLRLSQDAGAHREETTGVRFQQAEEDHQKRQLLPRYLPAYCLVQYTSQPVPKARISENRCFRH